MIIKITSHVTHDAHASEPSQTYQAQAKRLHSKHITLKYKFEYLNIAHFL